MRGRKDRKNRRQRVIEVGSRERDGRPLPKLEMGQRGIFKGAENGDNTAADFEEWVKAHREIRFIEGRETRHTVSLADFLVQLISRWQVEPCGSDRGVSDKMFQHWGGVSTYIAHNYLKYILMHVINNNAQDTAYLDACWVALRGAVSTAALKKAVQNSFLDRYFGRDSGDDPHFQFFRKGYDGEPLIADTFNLFFCYPFSNAVAAEIVLWMDPADLALSIRAGLNTFAKDLPEFQDRMKERLRWFCSGQGGRLVRQKIILAVIGQSDGTVYRAGEKAPVPLADDQKQFILTAFGEAIDKCLVESADVKTDPALVLGQLKKTLAAKNERDLIAELKYYCALLKGREEHLALYRQFALWLAGIYTKGIYADAQKAQALCDDVQAAELSNHIRLQLVQVVLASAQDPVRLYLAGVNLAMLMQDQKYERAADSIQTNYPRAVINSRRNSNPPRAFARRSRRRAIRVGLVVGILCAIAGAVLTATGVGSPLGVALIHLGLSTATAAVTTGVVAGAMGGTIVGASLWQQHQRIKQRLQKQVDEAEQKLTSLPVLDAVGS